MAFSKPDYLPAALRSRSPRERIAAIADAANVAWFPPTGPSPHLARYGIVAHEDDGIVVARIDIAGRPLLVAAQDERFLGGSVGARHGAALAALFERGRRDGWAILLLAASGGVRLHEANAAELELARALRVLVDVRAAGVPTLALAVHDVFGGASVLACATEHFAVLPGLRIGLSGPKVIATTQGHDDPAALDAVYAGAGRAAEGLVDAVADDVSAVRAWVSTACDGHAPRPLRRNDGALRPGSASVAVPLPPGWPARPVDGALWRGEGAWITAPFTGRHVDAPGLAALDAALLAHVGCTAGGPQVLIVVEDSLGHEVSRAAEASFLSCALARHAGVLGELRRRGVRIIGALTGQGHSAAFFTNALQADILFASTDARVLAMAPAAIARVTGLDAAQRIEDDALLGQPVRHFAALGGVAAVLDAMSPARLVALGSR